MLRILTTQSCGHGNRLRALCATDLVALDKVGAVLPVLPSHPENTDLAKPRSVPRVGATRHPALHRPTLKHHSLLLAPRVRLGHRAQQ